MIRKSDETTFAQDITNCDGTQANIITARQCVVPNAVLLAQPFNHNYGAEIYAKVIATNEYGDSAVSELGNGGIMMTNPDSPILVAEDVSLRAATSISLTWSDGPSNGGDLIIDYRIQMAQGDDVYSEVASGVTMTYHTVTGLTAGLTYKFMIESRNVVYYSSPSTPIEVLCAAKPDIVATPTTTNSNSVIVLDWDAPAENGLPITNYHILVQTSSLTFVQDLNYCIGNDANVLSNTECSIPQSLLIVSPYSLSMGDSVYVKISATNAYGSSDFSAMGNGAVVQLVPYQPRFLTNDEAVTSATVIKFSWSDGISDGGTAIIDYVVDYE